MPMPGKHWNADNIARLPVVADAVDDAVSVARQPVNHRLDSVAMTKRFPDLLALLAAGRQLVDPEPVRAVVEAKPRIDDVDRAETTVQFAQQLLVLFARDMNRRFAAANLLVLPESDLFHVQFLMGVIV